MRDQFDSYVAQAKPSPFESDPLLQAIRPNVAGKTMAELAVIHRDIQVYVNDPAILSSDPARHARHMAELAYLEHLIG